MTRAEHQARPLQNSLLVSSGTSGPLRGGGRYSTSGALDGLREARRSGLAQLLLPSSQGL